MTTLLESYRAHARYNRWMNEKIYALCAERLDDAARKLDRGAFFGSIHRTLNHLLLADRVWLGRFTGQPFTFGGLDQELYAEFETLRAERQKTDAELSAWVEGLDDAALEGRLEYKTSRGDLMSHPLWWAISHCFNHQTHHRGQVTTLLMQAGVDPGVTDLVAMLRSEAAASR